MRESNVSARGARPPGGPAGRRILLTRAEEDCAAWAAELEARGAAPVVFPCIECEDVGTPALRARLDAELPHARWIAFTSRRGVAAFARRRPGPLPVRLGVAAVGPATAEAARAAFGRVELVGPGGGAAALADALAGGLEAGDRVIAAVAENAGPALERTLAAAGHVCVRLDVYRTRPAPAQRPRRAFSSLGADAVFLASPSAVAGFARRVWLDTTPELFTIGPATTEAARAAGIGVTAEAARPELAGLLEAMQSEAKRCAT